MFCALRKPSQIINNVIKQSSSSSAQHQGFEIIFSRSTSTTNKCNFRHVHYCLWTPHSGARQGRFFSFNTNSVNNMSAICH